MQDHLECLSSCLRLTVCCVLVSALVASAQCEVLGTIGSFLCRATPLWLNLCQTTSQLPPTQLIFVYCWVVSILVPVKLCTGVYAIRVPSYVHCVLVL